MNYELILTNKNDGFNIPSKEEAKFKLKMNGCNNINLESTIFYDNTVKNT